MTYPKNPTELKLFLISALGAHARVKAIEDLYKYMGGDEYTNTAPKPKTTK